MDINDPLNKFSLSKSSTTSLSSTQQVLEKSYGNAQEHFNSGKNIPLILLNISVGLV